MNLPLRVRWLGGVVLFGLIGLAMAWSEGALGISLAMVSAVLGVAYGHFVGVQREEAILVERQEGRRVGYPWGRVILAAWVGMFLVPFILRPVGRDAEVLLGAMGCSFLAGAILVEALSPRLAGFTWPGSTGSGASASEAKETHRRHGKRHPKHRG